MNWITINFATSGFLIFISNFIIASLVFLRNPSIRVNRLFSLYFLSISIYGLGFFSQAISSEPSQETFSIKLIHAGTIFIPIFFIHSIYTFLDKKINKSILIGIYGVGIAFEFINIFTDLIDRNPIPKFGLKYVFQAGPLYPALIAFFLLLATITMWKLFLGYRCAIGTERNRLKFLFWGYVFAYLGGTPGFAIGYDINLFPFNPFAAYGVTICIIIIAYAMSKYHLLDTVLALRSVISALVFGILLVVPFLTFFISKTILIEILSGPHWWLLPFSVLMYAIIALITPSIYLFISDRTEAMIFKEQKRYQDALIELSKSISHILVLDNLLKLMTINIAELVNVEYCAIYLKDEGYSHYRLKACSPQSHTSKLHEFISNDEAIIKTLSKKNKPLLGEEINKERYNNCGLVIPFYSNAGILGIIILGAKKKNQMYTKEDVLTFEALSYSASLAIERCLFWQELEEKQRLARVREMELFSSSIAHEIHNPMTSIRLSAQLLGDFSKDLPDEKSKELKTMVSNIVRSQERVSDMVNAIREFGKKTTGEFAELKLADTIDSYLKLYLPIFKHEMISLSKEMPAEIPLIMGQNAEILGVLSNLSNNAIHALAGMEDKAILFKVEVPNREIIRISFKDNGYGINDEQLQNIFAPFVTTKTSAEGTGLGLYNCRRIIERHGGRIWAASEGSGKGAAFYIELPAIRSNV